MYGSNLITSPTSFSNLVSSSISFWNISFIFFVLSLQYLFIFKGIVFSFNPYIIRFSFPFYCNSHLIPFFSVFECCYRVTRWTCDHQPLSSPQELRVHRRIYRIYGKGQDCHSSHTSIPLLKMGSNHSLSVKDLKQP